MDDPSELKDSDRENDTSSEIELKREIVVPGDLLDEGELKAGMGTYQVGSKIYSAQVGIKNIRSNYVNVISLSGRYIPKSTDIVVGMVIDISPSSWIIDINSPYNAPLSSNEAPWRIDFGETSKYLNIGDIVLVKVMNVDEIKRVHITMRGPGLRKLNSGEVITISPLKVPRVIGKSGSMITLLKTHTNCQLFVGQNGRIWIDGSVDEIKLAIKTIRIIEQSAHVSGLTNIIENYLKESKSELNK